MLQVFQPPAAPWAATPKEEPMSMAVPYPVQLDLRADTRITRWRPLVQWPLAIPHLLIAFALRSLRQETAGCL